MTFAIPPVPRALGAINWLGLWTLYVKEVRRFAKVATQTVIAPVVTTLLFLAIFALALGGATREVGGVPFAQFLAPGLVMMAMVQMFGTVLNDHRRLVREELDRMASRSGDTPPPALGAPRANGSAESSDKAQFQTWVSQQLDSMGRQRSTEWADVVEKLKSHSGEG